MDIDYVARLAHLALSADEKERLGPQMAHILAWVRQMDEVTAADVPAASSAAMHLQFGRPDEPAPSLATEDALGNAPDGKAGLFRVPLIIER